MDTKSSNALGVIIDFNDPAPGDVQPDSPLRSNLNEIIKAAKNSTDITRQWLAFARKQYVDPKFLNLNINVENVLKPYILKIYPFPCIGGGRQ